MDDVFGLSDPTSRARVHEKEKKLKKLGVEEYYHHGKNMWVRSKLKGKHREHCLCFICEKFKIDDKENSCPIANALYRFDILANVTTPVWECLKFKAQL